MSFIEIQQNKKIKAYVVFPDIDGKDIELSSASRLKEAEGLALAINLDVCGKEVVRIREIKPGKYFSGGVLEHLKSIFKEKEIELFIVDTSLSPIQQRNLEKELQVKVIDRTALILEIFGERAQTKEGKLQVELAHLSYQRSRLVRSWTHLERQRGGAGFLGGPGETQIELDRRIIDDKILKIKKDLEKVKKTREIQRGARKRVPYPIVALVGYTNAGKSSLFNLLSQSQVFAKDLLFATLDNTLRKIKLPSGREVILTDTVGFISDLPHELIMAFRATLEEVLAADIIVHVRDSSNEDSLQQKKDVLSVLDNLGLSEIEQQHNYIELLNKVDLLEEGDKQKLNELTQQKTNLMLISAQTGEGKERFLQKIDEILSHESKKIKVCISASEGKTLAWFYQHSEIISVQNQKDTLVLTLKINNENLLKLQKFTPQIIRILD